MQLFCNFFSFFCEFCIFYGKTECEAKPHRKKPPTYNYTTDNEVHFS